MFSAPGLKFNLLPQWVFFFKISEDESARSQNPKDPGPSWGFLFFPFHAFLVLAAIKVMGQALITGTLFSYIFLFSLAGTFLSAVSMYTLRRLLGAGRISFIGIGVMGAMVSNVSQLALAWVFIFGNGVRYIAPPFLAAGLVTGIALGAFCEVFTRRSQWYAARRIR
jgi:heptaprenyl diphosphate synthase